MSAAPRLRSTNVLAASLLALALAGSAPALAAPTPEPGVTVTLADVEKVLGGKWTSRSPEPGVLFYEEEGGDYRQVNVYLWPANGKSVESLKAELVSQGEPVDDAPGVGDAAIYRPQRFEATAEQKDSAGELHWLAVAVHNAASADTQRMAVELTKRGAERLKKL